MSKEHIHIGNLIKKKLQELGYNEPWLANKIHQSRGNINHILKQQFIKLDTLSKISKALEYDFIAEYSNNRIYNTDDNKHILMIEVDNDKLSELKNDCNCKIIGHRSINNE
ncbi:MAG: hypothetical protein LBR81_06190 [Prevotellaceae bacterium]|jgi:DNA-binding Xre family transcriptional regulator|nr:hypothetical protein [Prevotellaceae bacterium]